MKKIKFIMSSLFLYTNVPYAMENAITSEFQYDATVYTEINRLIEPIKVSDEQLRKDSDIAHYQYNIQIPRELLIKDVKNLLVSRRDYTELPSEKVTDDLIRDLLAQKVFMEAAITYLDLVHKREFYGNLDERAIDLSRAAPLPGERLGVPQIPQNIRNSNMAFIRELNKELGEKDSIWHDYLADMINTYNNGLTS